MPDLKSEPYIILNYNQDSGQSDAFAPDAIPDYRGMLSIVRYRDNTRPAYNGDRIVSALNVGSSDNPIWATVLHSQGYQNVFGSLTQFLTVPLGLLVDTITNATTTLKLTTLEGLGVYNAGSPGEVQSADVSTVNLSAATTPGYVDYYIQIDAEIMRVTAISPDTNEITVTRAMESTTAAAHTAGAPITRFFGTTGVYTNTGVLQAATASTSNGTVYQPLFEINGRTAVTTFGGNRVRLAPLTDVYVDADSQLNVYSNAYFDGLVDISQASSFTVEGDHVALIDGNDVLYNAAGMTIPGTTGGLKYIQISRPASNSAGNSLSILASDARGTDAPGGDLVLSTGSSTGNASNVSIYFDTSNVGGSSNVLRAKTTRLTLNNAAATFYVGVSTTGNLTVDGTTRLATGLTGVLQASSGTVTAGTIAEADISNTIYTMTVGPFWYADLAASVTDGVGQLVVPSNSTPTMILSSATNANRWHVPATGKIVGISAHGIVTRTAGSATFYPRINNVQNTGISVVISNVQTQNNTTMVGYNSGVSISSGDKLAVSVDTTSTWAPTTGDMQIFLYVAFIVTK